MAHARSHLPRMTLYDSSEYVVQSLVHSTLDSNVKPNALYLADTPGASASSFRASVVSPTSTLHFLLKAHVYISPMIHD